MFRSSWIGDYNDAYTFAQYLKSDFGINLRTIRTCTMTPWSTRRRRIRSRPNAGSSSSRPRAVALADHPLIPIYFYVNKHLVKPARRRLVR